MFPLLQSDATNTLELFQIWINLPRKDKLTDPYFKMLWHEDIPVVKSEGTTIRIIAGTWGGQKAVSPPPNSWAMDPEHDVAIWEIHMAAGARLSLPVTDKQTHRSLYLYQGERIKINEQEITKEHGADLIPGAAISLKNTGEPASLLMLQGKPIAEPVAKYGPFVMNTQEEIHEAMREYRETEFGGWPWPKAEHVHPREKGRFALYPDGHLEER